MPPPDQLVLVNDRGDRQVVEIHENPRHNDGRLAELVARGYDFAEESADRDISILENTTDRFTGNRVQSIQNVRAGNLSEYLSGMQRLTGERPLIVTGDYNVSNYVASTQDEMARAQRVAELENSGLGQLQGLYSGVASLPIALGRVSGLIHERDENVLLGVDNMAELTEARPIMQGLGNIAPMLIPGTAGVRGLSMARGIQGAGIRVSQAAHRAGVGRIGQGLAGAVTEEALFTAASTLPLVYMQSNPELSGSMLLAGGGVGVALGYFAGPYFRGAGLSRRAQASQPGFDPSAGSIFGGRSSTASSPMARFIEDARNPPVHRPAPTNIESVRLSDMYPDLPMRSTGEERALGAPTSPRITALRSDIASGVSRSRAESNEYFNNLSPDDIAWYFQEETHRSLSIPETSNRSVSGQTGSPIPEISTTGLNQRTAQHIQERVDAFDEQLIATGAQGKPGFRTQGGDVYHPIINEDHYVALNNNQAAPTVFAQVRGHVDDMVAALRERANQAQGTTRRAYQELADDLRPLGDSDPTIPTNILRHSGRSDVPQTYLRGRPQPRNAAQVRSGVVNAMQENHTNLFNLWQRLGIGPASSVPEVITLRKYIGDILGGRRSARNLKRVTPYGLETTLREGAEVLDGPIFGKQASDRFNAASAAYGASHPGGAVAEIRRILANSDDNISPEKVRKMFEESGENLTQRQEELIFEALEEMENHTRQLAGLTGKPYVPPVPGEVSSLVPVGKTDLYTMPTGAAAVERARLVHAARRKHTELTVKSSGQSPTSLMGVALAQVGGGLAGAAAGPVAGWSVGGGLLASSLIERAIQQNPAFQLLQQGRARQQFMDTQRRIDSGVSNIRRGLLSRLRLGKRLRSTVRLTPARLGMSYFREDKSRKEQIEEYNELRQAISDMAADPIEMANQVEVSFAPMEQVSPPTAHAMRELTMRAVGYLASTLTKPTLDPLNIANVALPPSMAELDAFGHRMRMVMDPLSILDDIAAGFLPAESVEAGYAVFPSLMAEFNAAIGTMIADLGEDAAFIPYQMRVTLATLTGAATDTTLEGSFIRAMASRSAQTPQQASAQGLNRMRTRNIDVASGFMTRGQSLEEV